VSVRGPLITGTVASLAAVSAWSWMADLAIGPPGPLHMDRDLLSDYAELASAPTGNGWDLFTVVAVIYALCLLVSGWRRQRRGGA
jgi:nitrate reductase NapE component